MRQTFACCLMFIAPLASAQESFSYVCESFPVPEPGPPSKLVAAPPNTVWYYATNSNRLIRVNADRSVTQVVPVDGATGQLTGLGLAQDGTLWFSKGRDGRIGRIPITGGEGVEFALPANSSPSSIEIDSKGRVWFADNTLRKIGYASNNGNVVSFDMPRMGGASLGAGDIGIATDGGIWVTSAGHNAVYRVDPANGAFKRFDLPSARAQPGQILAGPDGRMWFTMPAARKIGSIAGSGQITEIDVAPDTPRQLGLGPDGALWFTLTNRTLGRIDPKNGRIDRIGCGGDKGMTIGPDGRLWVLGNGQMLIVKPRAEGTPAQLAAKSTVAIPAAPPAKTGKPASVETIDAVDLLKRLQAADGPVVVQYSSTDPNCTFCIPGNAYYDELAAASDSSIRFWRIWFEPWVSVSGSETQNLAGLHGLPTVALYRGSREQGRVEGVATAAELHQRLRLP